MVLMNLSKGSSVDTDIVLCCLVVINMMLRASRASHLVLRRVS